MPRSLTQEQVDSFRRDGFLVVEDVLSPRKSPCWRNGPT